MDKDNPMTFGERYDLEDSVVKGLNQLGYDQPTPVQSQVIEPIFAGKDVVVQADTGSGKTAGFGIPLVNEVHVLNNAIQGLILTPTRELAVQVSEELQKIGKYKGVRVLPVYGKQNIDIQIHQLKQRIHVVVGTPGRVMDLIEKGYLDRSALRFFVLDEGDELLRRGFFPVVSTIMDGLPCDKQILLFSATMPEDIVELVKRQLTEPVTIQVDSQIQTKNLIDSYVKMTSAECKKKLLCSVIEQLTPSQCLIFANTKVEVEAIYRFMKKRFRKVERLHGDLPQKQRLNYVDQFKKGEITYLIATDLASRGIHIHQLPLVINYDLPLDVQNYIHRIGRTGREGVKGTAVSLVGALDQRQKQELESYLRKTFKELPVAYTLPKIKTESRKKQAHIAKDTVTIRISAGQQKKIRVGDIVGALCHLDGIEVEDIGIIDIRNRYSYVEIFHHKGEDVVRQLNERKIKKKQVFVEIMEAKK